MSIEPVDQTQELRTQLTTALQLAKTRTTAAKARFTEAAKAESAIAKALVALGGAPVTAKPEAAKPGPRPSAVVKETPKAAAGGAK